MISTLLKIDFSGHAVTHYNLAILCDGLSRRTPMHRALAHFSPAYQASGKRQDQDRQVAG